VTAAVTILVMAVLLALKGFFSGSEIALVSADKVRLRARAGQGHKGSELVLKLFRRPEYLLGTTLVGTNLATVSLVTMGAALFYALAGDGGDFYAFLFLTPLLLIFGEIVPKSVYQQKADDLAPVIIYPLWLFSLLFSPVVFVFSRIARLAANLAGVKGTDKAGYVIREQIRAMVEMAEGVASLDVFDKTRVRHAMRFGHTTVGEVMVPISEMIAVESGRSTGKAIALMRKGGYTRLPVYEEKVSNIVGIAVLSPWDIMDHATPRRDLSDFVRPTHFVSGHQKIDELLPVLHRREDRMAVVVDEFGSSVGIVTLEDILEKVVGPIDHGRYADASVGRRTRRVTQMDDEVWTVDARLPIADLNDLLEVELPAREFHTVGGLVTARLRRLPDEGENVSESGWRFTVTRVSERAVLEVKIERGG
jgi:putative hemolysin